MASTKGTIGFEHVGIGTALSRNRLMVPVNQRDYAWEEKHVTALFQDFLKAIGANKSAYFLGSIVLTTSKKGDGLEVSDGQQRLATTTILLAAIRDYFHGQNDTLLVNSIENDFLFSVVRETRLTVPRLTLNANDHEFFEKRILVRADAPGRRSKATKAKREDKESHELIEQAADLAAKHVKSILAAHTSEKSRAEVLNRWVKFIEESAQVILLRVPDDLNAFVMFETLNDRGRRTSQADLLKNYLFGEADDRLAEAQQKWSSMAGALEALGIDDILMTYLRHLTISLHGYTIERDVYERIQDKTSGKGQAIEFLDALEANANTYVAMLTPNHAHWNDYPPDIRKSIETMVELRAIPFRPLMLSVARKFIPGETEKSFRLFVRWAVRFLIAGGGRSGSVEQTAAAAAVRVSEGTITTAKQLVTAMAGVIPSDTEFETAFSVAKVSQQYLARYYLRALELHKKQVPDPEWIPNDSVVINLEHVLPENPGSHWTEIDADVAAANYRRIGNMVLLQANKNTLIGNGPFSDKRLVLKGSAYQLTSEVGKFPVWGIEQINIRQKALARLAIETWPRDLS